MQSRAQRKLSATVQSTLDCDDGSKGLKLKSWLANLDNSSYARSLRSKGSPKTREEVQRNERSSDDNISDLELNSSPSFEDEYTPKKTKKKTKKKATKPVVALGPRDSGPKSEEAYEETFGEEKPSIVVDCKEIYLLAAKYPDTSWRHALNDEFIKRINSRNPLKLITEANIRDQGHITGMTLSPDGTMLATFSTFGVVRIWDLNDFKNIQTLKDRDESTISEFYVGQFVPNTSYLAVAGKLKDPKKWSQEDGDNHILPTPIKIFDLITGEVVNILNGHEEEILCLKTVIYKKENYFITTSQDGYIMKWSMSKGWTNLIKVSRIEDGETCMAFNVSFLPNTAERLFVASCDNHVALFDFELERKIQKFGDLYSCYCDCVLVTPCFELEPPNFPDISQFQQSLDMNIDAELAPEKLESCYAYILSRGVEEVEEIDGVLINTIPNAVCLHKLKYPTKPGEKFTLEGVRKFTHPEYRSNSWLIKIESNGIYVAAPTYEGTVFLFNLATGNCAAILRDHEEVEVRAVLFHPTRKLFFSCADDGTVKVYTQDSQNVLEEKPCCSG